MGQLQDQVAIVTGAASGIGAASARRLEADGATVVTMDVTEGTDHTLDVRDEQAVADAVHSVVDQHGHIDVAVNAAGVAGGGPVHLVDGEEWDRVLDVNLKGTFHVCKYVCEQMVTQRSGSIVNIASVEGLEGTEGGSVYNASKGGVVMLTKSMAIDYGANQIRVNAICPGGVQTPLLTSLIDQPGMEGYRQRMLDTHLLGRFGQPYPAPDRRPAGPL